MKTCSVRLKCRSQYVSDNRETNDKHNSLYVLSTMNNIFHDKLELVVEFRRAELHVMNLDWYRSFLTNPKPSFSVSNLFIVIWDLLVYLFLLEKAMIYPTLNQTWVFG